LEALLAVRGGHGSLRLLPLLEPLWKSFPAHKPIIGFSDVTALHLARLSAAGAGGWHGPNLLYYTRKNHKNYLEFLRGLKPREWLFGKGEVLVPGDTAGPVMGGNLTIFAHVYGTGYSPPSKGRILLLEDVGEKPYAIDRLLTTLLLRGAFEGALGVVLGSFASCGNPGELRDLILHFFQSFKIPVLINAPFGHGIENRPWFYGERGVLFASRRAGGRLFFPLEN
jgi:muramoyltetrapeptide carboxypeptidase